MIVLAHFSDVHLGTRSPGWHARDFVGKRVYGWANLTLGRRRRAFRHGDAIVEALLTEFRTRKFDGLIFSGDATELGFEREIAVAAAKLGVENSCLPSAIAVPGNHDLYTHASARNGVFERSFALWQQGIRVSEEHLYPFARRIGHVWLIALNSATPNVLPWDASGEVGSEQCERLRELCIQLSPGPRVIVSHYPIMREDGTPEGRWHGLRDWRDVRDVTQECGISLWLHGHRHKWYFLENGVASPFHSICAGSITQTNNQSYFEYRIEGVILEAQRWIFDPANAGFRKGEAFTQQLSNA